MATILYTDTRNQHRINADGQDQIIFDICQRYMIIPSWFDLVHIDLRGDIEACTFYDCITQSRVASLGGASAWAVYREIAQLFPEINHHFSPYQPVSTPGV